LASALEHDAVRRYELSAQSGRVNVRIDPDAPAILIWLPEGITPSDRDFEGNQSWTLEQAAEQAYNVSKDHNKRPWIRSDGRILGESEIAQIMSGLRAMRRLGG
jgi:hypothetical protein